MTDQITDPCGRRRRAGSLPIAMDDLWSTTRGFDGRIFFSGESAVSSMFVMDALDRFALSTGCRSCACLESDGVGRGND
jgi:hypothetical protein